MSPESLYFALRVTFAAMLVLLVVWVVRVMLREVAVLANPLRAAPTPTGEALAELIVLDAAESSLVAGASLPVGKRATIGRGEHAQIRIDDPSVSSAHALIIAGPSGWILEDLASRNGTAINGMDISGAVDLVNGDVVETGRVVLRFVC